MDNLEELLNDDNKRQEIITALNNQGVKTFTEEKLDEYVSNVTNDKVTEAVKKSKFELKTGFEKDVEGLTGEAKGPNEPTHEYIKRMMGKYKGLASELDEKLKGSINADEEIKKVQSAFAEKEQEYLNTIEGLENKFKDNAKEVKFNSELKSLNIASDVDNEYLELKLEQVKAKYKNRLKEDDNGNLVLTDEKGNIERNPDNNMNPFTLNEVLNKELDKFIDKGRQIDGAGTKPSNTTANQNKDVPSDLESSLSSETDESIIYQKVQEYYISKGKSAHSGEVGRAFTAIMATKNK